MRVRAEYDIVQEKESHNYVNFRHNFYSILHPYVSGKIVLTEISCNVLQHKDITALEEGIRTLLEICNSCLTSNLRSNPHFIYTILYKRNLFDTFQNHPMFQDLIWNICTVRKHIFILIMECLSSMQI